jgi:hypothetical protein
MWKILRQLTIVTFLIMAITDVEAKKKAKGKTVKGSSSEQPEKSSAKRPTSTSPELYCNSCQAITRELLKKLRHRKSESDVMEALDDICNPELYMIYEFPPPEMRGGCETFIMDWEEVFEKEMQTRTNNHDIEDKICYQITQACNNVNVKDAPRFDNQIFVDGQPVPVGEGGKVNIRGGDEEHNEL